MHLLQLKLNKIKGYNGREELVCIVMSGPMITLGMCNAHQWSDSSRAVGVGAGGIISSGDTGSSVEVPLLLVNGRPVSGRPFTKLEVGVAAAAYTVALWCAPPHNAVCSIVDAAAVVEVACDAAGFAVPKIVAFLIAAHVLAVVRGAVSSGGE